MKRLSIAAAAAALMLAVAPQLHAQAAQQGHKDTTKAAAKAAKPAASKSAASASKSSASTKTASTKSRKAKKSMKAKADTTAKKSEE